MSEYAAAGHVTLHWSRLLAGAFSLSCCLQTAVFALLLKVLSVWKGQQTQQGSSAGDEPASSHSREMASISANAPQSE
jgi:hypothetical protein